MRVTVINPDALKRMAAKLRRAEQGVTTADLKQLGDAWSAVMVEDNRIGVLSGIDKDSKQAPPLWYRGGFDRILTRKRARKKGFGKSSQVPWYRAKGAGNNLTTAQYKKMTGPRLAPRRRASRVITNHVVKVETGPNRLRVVGGWADVVSKDNKPFLHYHFEGTGRMDRYDLRGVRQWGLTKALQMQRTWIRSIMRLRLS